LQAALLPKLTAIEEDLAGLRAEVRHRDQEARAGRIESDRELRAELKQNSQKLGAELKQSKHELRAEIHQSSQELRADMDRKFSLSLSETRRSASAWN
jgi:DNA anti-recombination protein RmuC